MSEASQAEPRSAAAGTGGEQHVALQVPINPRLVATDDPSRLRWQLGARRHDAGPLQWGEDSEDLRVQAGQSA
ncbi:MAG TPA: hypothetical protein VFB54_06865 [Burkholderiales bacterium]|nr:hypothetical protein [Burkholderiales bacterium]